MNAGFVGLGAVGRPMAANLIEAGHRLRLWDRSRPQAEELARKGAEMVSEPREAFREVLISTLADDTAVRDVILGSGMLERAPRDVIAAAIECVLEAIAHGDGELDWAALAEAPRCMPRDGAGGAAVSWKRYSKGMRGCRRRIGRR